ncbi:hypothetical protein [Nocardia sp. BMG111209]|uniref:hypothetical protein n=1 Tax=Nocardia sp. BMG111209 TaxID=1160137 RepID=UPI0012DC751E
MSTDFDGISEEHHGPAADRRYNYLRTFILRGVTKLHVECTPAAPAQLPGPRGG